MVYPKFLSKGDFIGVTAPSMGVTDENDILRLENAYKNLKKLGYKYIETQNVRKNEKFVSSSPIERAKEFEELWENNEVSLIVSASGGEFLMEMLPYINKEKIKNKSPKWVQGYSDTSLLLYYLTTNFNIATVHSVNAKSFGMEKLYKSIIKTLDILNGENKSLQNNFDLYEKERFPDDEYLAGYNLTEKVEYKHLYGKDKDTIKGRLIGGCIDVISILLGTKLDNTKNFIKKFNEGMIWYLDNCELSLMSFDRIIWQMKQAGWFDNAKGILIGRTHIEKQIWDLSYEDTLHKAFDDLNIPVIYDIDVGHVAPQWTMINGSLAEFSYENGKGSILQSFE